MVSDIVEGTWQKKAAHLKKAARLKAKKEKEKGGAGGWDTLPDHHPRVMPTPTSPHLTSHLG